MKRHLTATLDTMQRRFHVGSRVDKTLGKMTAANLSQGDMRLRNINKTLNNLGVIRSADQILFHESFVAACLPHIYGPEDWSAHSVRVMQEHQMTDIKYEVLAMTPRR
jgi:hypothetical protein